MRVRFNMINATSIVGSVEPHMPETSPANWIRVINAVYEGRTHAVMWVQPLNVISIEKVKE